MSISEDTQRLEQDAIVTMFELDVRSTGNGVLRFSSTSDGGQPVVFNGEEYPALPIAAEGFSWSGTGTMPRPTLTLMAPDLVFLSLVLNADDLVGCPVTRIRTYRKYLDNGPLPNPEAVFPIDSFVVEKRSSQKRLHLVFELSAEMDQQGKMLPGRQILRDACSHRFRYWVDGQWNYAGATCPYSGVAMYTRGGDPTIDPLKARCGKRLSDCKRHFGETAVLPFYGFPGVGRL
jgi:lambda family phage minor tail protein L